nr:MAG TPA: hypothetical protein [Caudoviricetes sp.]
MVSSRTLRISITSRTSFWYLAAISLYCISTSPFPLWYNLRQ